MTRYFGGWSMLAFWPLLSILAYIWFRKIETVVPEPYLDEVLHVGQAKMYLQGRWDVWDPKITTPPGLYLLSYLQQSFLPVLDNFAASDTSKFRIVNLVAATGFLIWEVRRILLLILGLDCDDQSKASLAKSELAPRWPLEELNHTIFNICLFPPLFFFYGLYYTDVVSALLVLMTYRFHLQRANKSLVLAGLASLLFRQTNIFWVSIFLGGLQVNRSLLRGHPGIEFPDRSTFMDVVTGSLRHGYLYDPLLSNAHAEDYLKTCFSIILAAVTNWRIILRSLAPYLLLLGVFGTFVKVNGGVVLGDKENHVASIHPVKMLYIWPYFMFFSFPLLYPYLICGLIPRGIMPRSLRSAKLPRPPRLFIQLFNIILMLAVVHYNTTVHPFTLADNRHYMFYVFRLLLRHRLIKYAVVPVYFYCGYATTAAFGGIFDAQDSRTQNSSSTQVQHNPRNKLSPLAVAHPSQGSRISFVLLWFCATTLSLVTAPLVEPRYFIIPWLVWRLHIHYPRTKLSATQVKKKSHVKRNGFFSILDGVIRSLVYADQRHRLWLECVWFLFINWATTYIFLYRGFEWPQEPDKVQRFMW